MGAESVNSSYSKCKSLNTGSIFKTETIQQIANHATADYSLIITKETNIKLGYFALDRFISFAEDTGAGMVYADYYEMTGNIPKKHPVLDYQQGSLRDDFNFGPLLFINSLALKNAVEGLTETFEFAGIYQMRLAISKKHSLFHIPEFLYSQIESDTRASGKKIFDYVDPKNRSVQIEMEKAVTTHLKEIGAFLTPQFKNVAIHESDFPVEASVIIPVRNREKTIADAIDSVMKQKTNFKYN